MPENTLFRGNDTYNREFAIKIKEYVQRTKYISTLNIFFEEIYPDNRFNTWVSEEQKA